MKRKALFILAPCCVVVVLANSAVAQNAPQASIAKPQVQIETANVSPNKNAAANDSAGEVELLRKRVEEIERQNRELLKILSDLSAKLEALSHPEITNNTALSANAPPPVTKNAPQAQAPATQDDKNAPVRWSELLGEGNKIKFYGFLRLDMIFDSQRPNNAQTILFIPSPDPLTGNTTDGNFTMHPRLTRLGINYTGPRIAKLGDAKLSGQLETDFQNGGSESRQIIRIRHAFLRLDWQDVWLLGGQTWDIVSPLFPTVNGDTLQWNAGNVGDRRPQLRVGYEPKAGRGKFSLVGGVGLTGAIDAADIDGNGVRDGEESSRPNIQGRIGFSHQLGSKDRIASLGISGFYGFLKTARPIVGRTEFHSRLINVDFTLPILSQLAFKGEAWWGRNMSDVRGGAGQGVNVSTGREIRGRGGWAEVNIKPSRYFSINPGFSTDDPINADIPSGGRTRNRAFFIANRITPGGNFTFGADYLRWKTDFLGFKTAVDNRFNIFWQYNF
jgi:hypothetical protein